MCDTIDLVGTKEIVLSCNLRLRQALNSIAGNVSHFLCGVTRHSYNGAALPNVQSHFNLRTTATAAAIPTARAAAATSLRL
mmetsp:Transcript_17706/g.29542  ORF Transcript_17706/g.29542 Transcript_17706/m.29542 type:complete len:81 (+) Transcript_17706:141-383(+)